MAGVTKKDDGPETPAQAQWWTKWYNRYVRYGLCYKCAAQAAYGHQLGFTRINPPCDSCAFLVPRLPTPRASGWRSLEVGTGFASADENIPARAVTREGSDVLVEEEV